MHRIPAPVRPVLRQLRRRLALGLFLEIWPIWAGAALLVAGTVALVCRMFVPDVARWLPWLWLAPVVTAIPALVIGLRRAYRPHEVAALADWLSGGHGMLLALAETNDAAWATTPLAEEASRFALPRFRFRSALILLGPATLFLAVVLLLPQRIVSPVGSGALAKEMAADLTAAVVELKKQDLITPAEEEKLQEEIERLQRTAEKRMDASAWEAADALREKVAAGLAEKQEAAKWAQDSLARYAAAVQAGGGVADSNAAAQATELTKALEKLAQSGLLAGASPELKAMLTGGNLPTDLAALQALASALGDALRDAQGKIAGLGEMGGAFGRFDPAEFPVGATGPDGDGYPGTGGVNRGRADATMTWGKETDRVDKFKSKPLPPGAPRSPDDWAPVVVLPGSPEESATLSRRTAGRDYAAGAGQGAWRRSLAPRHQTAVKKYFDTTVPKKPGGGL
jgi:hypothetical protein